jgi:CheY-like chemotaxis protein
MSPQMSPDLTLSKYEIILIASADLLEQAVSLYHPRAVLINSAPDVEGPVIGGLDLPIPIIHFSLPSARWLVDRMGLHACLAKPVTGEQIQRELKRLPHARTILVVDDDPNFSQLIERMLQSLDPDLSIFSADGGQMAVEMVHAHRPDLVFLDLSMPEVDGFAVIERVRKEPALAATPIILLTANLHPENLVTWTDNRVLIERRGDLRTVETLELLNAALGVLKPDYSESTDKILTKLKIS